jgi:hypothetical protein
MAALRDHFAGEGNATRTVAEADRLKETLHYKSERAMSFETFLTQMQKMFNIYEKQGEPIPEEQKVRMLFKKISQKDLESSVSALKAQQTAGTNVTYTMAANHIATAVSELPEYISRNRNVSGVTSGTGGDDDGSGIRNADGSIKTGHIPNWKSLTREERLEVYNERKRLGVSYKKGGGKGGGKSPTKSNDSQMNTIRQLRANNKKQKRRIKALKSGKSDDDNTRSTEASDSEDEDAGDSFGGKASKKVRIRSTKK